MHRRTLLRALTGLGAATVAGCLDRSGPAGTGAEQTTSEDMNDTTTDDPATDDATTTPEPETTAPPDETTAGTEESSMQASSGAWPTFGADAGRTGVRPNGDGPSTGTIAWSAIGDAPTVFCPPTVADGVVYTGSAADAVHAFDAETGEDRWEFPTTSYVETAPAVRDGRVYTADADGVVYALTTDGEEVWRHDTGQNLHCRTLAVRDGTVYVGTAGDMPAVVSGETDASRAGNVLALDAEAGDELWSFQGPEDWFTGPALGDGRVYVGNHDGSVFALDADSGEESWSWSAEDVDADVDAEGASVLAPPTYAGDTVYASVHGAGWVVALDAATGDVDWRADLDAENVKSSPAVAEDRVFVGSHRIRVGELEPPTVGSDDARSTDESPTPTATPTATEGTPTPEPGMTGRLYALARDDGSEAWVHETDHDLRSSPAVVGDTVYVGGGDGALAVARADGSEQWRVTFEDYVASSPAVAGGRLFLGSADGHLYCVAADDRRV